MPIDFIVTGPEERELNGPFKPPLWDGSDGTREGQHAFDADGTIDGIPGPIWWDGTVWIRYGTGTGTGQNIGNTDLELTQDRTLGGTASNFKLEFNDLGQFILNTVLTGAATQQFINAGSTEIESASEMSIKSVSNNVNLTAITGQITLSTPEVIATSLSSGAPGVFKIVVAGNGGLLSTQSTVDIINTPYTSAVTSDNLLINSFLNGLFPTAEVGTQKIFTNITDAPGNTAVAIMHAVASWSVKIDFIKCS